ncbi:MAG: membrane protein insertase YidC [Anaerolineae bacterium]|nr:membrane protein insertase YidC [Anaerolineae bacterium]
MLDLIVNPFITMLLFFYSILGNVFLAIVAFTVVIRLALFPLTLRQQRSMKAMQEVQPELRALQEQYKDNREMLVQKQMELYRERKINPLASCLPIFIQLPILIGLWRAIIATLALSPAELLSLSDRILMPGLERVVPMDNQFLWLNLAVPDPYIVLPVLVMVTSYIQQKLLTPPMPKRKPGEQRSDDPAEQAAQMTRQMTTYMPIMFGFISLTYSSGLSIYFIISNLIGIAQYSAMGNADYRRLLGRVPPSEVELAELTDVHGRLRKASITDTLWEEKGGRVAIPSTAIEEKRSERLARAMASARRASSEAE